MRNVLFITMFLLPFITAAQGSFDIVAAGGFNTSFDFTRSKSTLIDGTATGYNGTLQLMYNAEIWQIGAGIETGTIKGTAIRSSVDRIHGGYTMGMPYTDQGIANPYIAPNLLLNFKAWLSEQIYLYFGGTGGYMIAGSDMVSIGAKAKGPLAGINAGVTIMITDVIGINISECWKQVWLKDEEALKFMPDYYSIDPAPVLVPEYKLNYNFFTTNIGVRFSL